MAVVLILVKKEQIYINETIKYTVQTIQNSVNASTHITKTPTQLSKHAHIHRITYYKTHTYSHPHITKPTHTHTHILQNPNLHTLTHYKTHTYTHSLITKPTHTHTHTLQNPHTHTHTHKLQNPHIHTLTHYRTHSYTHTHPHIMKNPVTKLIMRMLQMCY